MVRSHCYCYFFYLISLLYTYASPTLGLCRQDQIDALLEFKDEFPSLQHNDKSLSSWNKSSTDCCSWEGITCDAKSSEVISLSLSDIFLNNSLKPNSGLFKLQHLQSLRLDNCSLYGEIPSSLGNLSYLTYLVLSYNGLVGQVPESLGNLTQLKRLLLPENSLTGNIPVSFANLTKLSTFNINNNFLESTLPDMSGFHNLEQFDLGGNSFSGSFPSSLFTISSLAFVNLTGNRFKGLIDFGNISSFSRLGYLFLALNKFHGPIPNSLSEFTNLQVLDLGRNRLSGTIPKSISRLAKLDFIDLSKNNLEGQVPGCLWGLTAMILSHNSFTSFEKSDETQMQLLNVQSNLFRGPFPYWICKLRSLRQLDLSNNSFSGLIPQCLWNATNSLGVLLLRYNNFSGIFPDVFSNATKLEAFDVSRNHFQGKLPRSLISCKGLEFLNVESNRIKDEFPSWLSSMPSLNVLILRSNQFFGPLYHHNVSIGFQSLRVIDVSNNDFAGKLPSFYFSHWREMSTLTGEFDETYMEDSSHYLGVYSNSMEMVHKGVDTEFERIGRDFRAIDFSGNRFLGNIPESIGLLKELRVLNLSGNAFTSSIPQALVNLTKLEALDLSRNQLSGRIPGDLGRLSFLSVMNFSQNNLEGPLPGGTQFQRQRCSSFMHNPKLYGFEDICGERTRVPNPTPKESEDLSEPKEQVISWIAAAIAYGPGVFCGLVIGHIFAPHKHKWFMEKFGRKKPRTAITNTH